MGPICNESADVVQYSSVQVQVVMYKYVRIMYKYGCTSISKLGTSMDVQVCPNYVQVWQK